MTVPSDWQEVALASVAQLKAGGTPPRSNPAFYASPEVRWVKTGDLTDAAVLETAERISQSAVSACRLRVHDPDTVLVAMYGGFNQIGRTGILAVPAATNQALIAICCDPRALDPYYLQSVLNARVDHWRTVAGSSRKDANITKSDVAAFRLLLPPLQDQRAIAHVARLWGQANTSATALLDAKRRYKCGLMQRVFAAHNDDGARTRRIGALISESRERSATGDHAKKLTVRLYGRGIVAKHERQAGSANTQYYRRRAGQFVYSKLDFLNGAFGIVPSSLDGYETTLDLPAFDLSDDVNSRWLLHLLSWPGFHKRHVGIANGGRKARRVNPSDLLKVGLHLPSSARQKSAADLLDCLDREIALLERLQGLLARQKRAILDRLLTGQLRLTSDDA